MRKLLAALALLLAPIAAVAPIASADVPDEPCIPEVIYRDNGNVVVRFHGTVAACLPLWESWNLDIPPGLDEQWELFSWEHNPTSDITTLKFRPA